MTSTERLIQTAKQAGVPKEQLQTFLNAAYCPLPWQLLFHAAARQCDLPDGPIEVAAGGARGPGKSHGCFAQAAVDDCQRCDGLKVLFLRKTAVSAKESFGDLIDKVLRGRIPFSQAGNVLTVGKESRIILGGFHDANDIDKYIGIEYDVIVVEEANQLSEEKLEKLKGSLRTSKQNWRPRMYLSFNPGGTGHGFVKKRYVIPHRESRETTTRFIPSTYRDNPFLNKEYTDYLEGLGGNLGKAWREGDFDIFDGQYFSEWRFDIHTCEPFKIPPDWKRYRGLDHGGVSPTACLWFALAPDGMMYCYREYYAADRYASTHTNKIAELSVGEEITYTAADPSIWIKTTTDGKAPQEFYEAGGVPLTKANNDRVNGWAVVREYLKAPPKLLVFRTCINLIRNMPEMVHSEKNPEDMVTEFPTSIEGTRDDLPDALRYFLISRSYPARLRQEEAPVGSFQWTINQLKKQREDNET